MTVDIVGLIRLCQAPIRQRIGQASRMNDLVSNIEAAMARRAVGAIKLAQDAGLGRTAVADILSGRSENPRYATLQKIAAALSVSVEELTVGQDSSPATVEPARYGQADLPVYASAQGGPDGMVIVMEPIEYIRRPDFLDRVPDAFAFYVTGDSMEPRYEQGERLLIHPRRPARAGSDVLVILNTQDGAEHAAMVKRLVSLSRDKVRLRQFNPPRDFDLSRSEISNIFKIMGTQVAD